MSRSNVEKIGERHAQHDPIGALEGRWTLQILLRLKEGDMRFSDLRSALPKLSANILTQRLRDLEAVGLIERRHIPPPAASQVYSLSPAAEILRPALEHLADWKMRQLGGRSIRA